MKTIAIMQPYFFPYIGYWQLIHAVDRFIILDDVNYIKRGWINRNRLLINGEPSYITVPVHQASQNRKICELSLQTTENWRDKLVRMVEITYRKAPYFSDAFPVIEKLIRHTDDNLSAYMVYQLRSIAGFLGISTEFELTSRVYGNQDMAGQERIIDICKREGATRYINPQGGQQIYDDGAFSNAGIDLRFIIPRPRNYRQWSDVFIPYLSIIDVMMFNSKEKIHADFLGDFDLIETRELRGLLPHEQDR